MKRKTVKPRQIKGLLSLIGLLGLALIINSYIERNDREVQFPEILYGIPTYPNSHFSSIMSSLNGDPYTAVFLSPDPYETILQFYKEKLKMDYKIQEFGLKRRNRMPLTVYQFELEKGILEHSINKGVEIISFNSRNQRMYNALTKIKIILPRKEVVELNKKSDNSTDR